jgi:Cu(I)/Ag(I) efflux system membrane fusion protein/cobalt-zinc-cadmium efflux system membrane fusion protein
MRNVMNEITKSRALLVVVGVAAAVGATWVSWRYDLPLRIMNTAFVALGWGETGAFESAAFVEAQPADPETRAVVTLDARRQQLAGIQTVAAEMRPLDRTIRLTGILQPDERRLVDVNVKLDGWIREIRVDYSGRFVRQGEPLFTLYSPELAATQQEYLLARSSRDEIAGSPLPDARGYADRLVDSAERRLQRWDISRDQIADFAARRTVDGQVSVPSPASGFVVEKTAIEGMHIEAGQTLYRIADLSSLWLEASVYEQDLSAVHLNQRGSVAIDSLPGTEIPARIAYISPSLDPETRTAKIRFEMANAGGRLKPGMFATVGLRTAAQPVLVLPANAVLDSGTRQIVFVDRGEGRFEPRDVEVGARANGMVSVSGGLKAGERVASSAVFLLDSESQLRAALQSFNAPTDSGSVSPAAAASSLLTFHVVPNPAKVGENTFEATLKDVDGAAIDDARVEVTLFMPAMPTMNMPPMRHQFAIPRVAAGVYRGPGHVMTAGQWQVTVTAARGGRPVATLNGNLVAQ